MSYSFSWDEEFENLRFNGSSRLKKRFIRTMETLSKSPEKSILASSSSRAEAKAIYNMLNSDNFLLEEVKKEHRAGTIRRIIDSEQKVILAIQDTSGINYGNHKKTEGLGYFCEKTLGINLHTCLAVTTDGITLGVLDQSTITRLKDEEEPPKKHRKIEDKESNRWLETVENSIKDMPPEIKVIHVCDREGDIYQLFNKIIDTDNKFLVRVKHNRTTVEDKKIIDDIKGKTPNGYVNVTIPRDSRRGLQPRDAILDITFCNYDIKKPDILKDEAGLLDSINVNIIYVKERQTNEDIEPIEWILTTNDQIKSVEDAYEKVEYYIQRWKIERFHYVLKSGCAVEKIQERSVDRIIPLLYMYSITSVFIMNLTYIARVNPDLPCSVLFHEEEWKILYRAANKTKESPNEVYSIGEAVKYLGILGAGKRAPSDGPPGLKTIWIGLSTLNILKEYAGCF